MSANVAFLARLRQIADDTTPSEQRALSAVGLLAAYRAQLNARLGISQSGRIKQRAKALAEDALDDLRLKVLKAEMCAAGPSAALFATTRYRIEMDRRALAMRLAEDDHICSPSVAAIHTVRMPIHARSDDRRIISSLRRGLSDRRGVIMSWQAIRESLDLLHRRQDPRID